MFCMITSFSTQIEGCLFSGALKLSRKLWNSECPGPLLAGSNKKYLTDNKDWNRPIKCQRVSTLLKKSFLIQHIFRGNVYYCWTYVFLIIFGMYFKSVKEVLLRCLRKYCCKNGQQNYQINRNLVSCTPYFYLNVHYLIKNFPHIKFWYTKSF